MKAEHEKKCEKCDFIIRSEDHRKKHMAVRHGDCGSLLWVADTIQSNVDFKFLKQKLKKKIKTAKAFSATSDTDSGCSEKSFLDVIDMELSGDTYDTLVIGGGSVDISNINTIDEPFENILDIREQAIESARKLFSIAEAALQHHQSLKQVNLKKRTPRFDPTEQDPHTLKPQLSALADSVTFGFWCDSKFKDKIILGGHDVPNGEGQLREVFGAQEDKDFDGVHMNGPLGKFFLTQSFEKVFKIAGIIRETSVTNREPPVDLGAPQQRKRSVRHLPEGWTASQTRRARQVPNPPSSNTSPQLLHPQQRYDAMGMMIERVRSLSSARPETDDVFGNPNNARSRASVIKMPTNNKLQEFYNIPVSNHFTTLLN